LWERGIECGVSFPYRQSRLCFVFLLCFSLVLSSCSLSPHAIAITHVTVIDVAGGPSQTDSTVIVYGAQISAVGPSLSVAIPRGARVIDGSRKFVIPALVDMHVHLTGAGEPTGSREFFLPLLVANGITTVRDMGGKVEYLKQLRGEIDSGKRLGPRIFFTGPYLDGDPPSFQPSIVVRTAEDGKQAVDQLKKQGVDFIKVQSRLSRGAYFAIAAESRAQGIRFVGHVPDTVSAFEASDAGQASIEHLTGILVATSSKEEELRREQLAPAPAGTTADSAVERNRVWLRSMLESQSPQKTDALLREFVKNRTVQVPTFPILVHLGFMTPETDLRHDALRKYLSTQLRQIWDEGRRESVEHLSEPDFDLRRELLKRSLEIVGKMIAAGVPIIAGTDAAAPNVFPGFSLHEDLELMVVVGMTPLQALQAATSTPATFLGVRGEQGSVAEGQRADLVLLDADPLLDISNARRIRAVVLDGKLLEKSELDELLASAERFAAAH
jgi:imidazolonepropionase-like amidohydrolase